MVSTAPFLIWCAAIDLAGCTCLSVLYLVISALCTVPAILTQVSNPYRNGLCLLVLTLTQACHSATLTLMLSAHQHSAAMQQYNATITAQKRCPEALRQCCERTVSQAEPAARHNLLCHQRTQSTHSDRSSTRLMQTAWCCKNPVQGSNL
jgi:hypothetical protein